MSTLSEKIAVMQAAERGAVIEAAVKNTDQWCVVYKPLWDWCAQNYRVRSKVYETWVLLYPDGSMRSCESEKEANYQVSRVKEFYPTARAALMREVL